MTSPGRRVWWLIATVLVLAAGTPTAVAAAAPQGEYAGTLRFEVDSFTPALVTAQASTVVIRGSMVNTGPEELTGVVARWQRGDAFDSTAEVLSEIDEPGQPDSVITSFAPVTEVIGAGEAVDFTLRTDAFTRPRSGLGIGAPGVYPVMLNVNASFASGPTAGARVGELHVLLTVGSVPGGVAVTGSPQPVSMLMPLVDRPHRDPTGAFFDDDLAALIAPGGRLDDVLSAAEAPGLPAGAVTLAVDPELLEELQLMSDGYVVGPVLFDITQGAAAAGATASPTPTSAAPTTTTPSADPAGIGTTADISTAAPPSTAAPTTPPTGDAPDTAPEPTRDTQPDPARVTTTNTPSPSAAPGAGGEPVPAPGAVPGAGAADAQAFLDRVRELSVTTPVLVLPYTDIDAVAAVRAGLPEQVTDTVTRGRRLAADLLGPQAQLITGVGWPLNGLVDPETLSVLRDTGQTTVLLDRTGVEGADGDRAMIDTGSGQVAAILAAPSVPDSPVELNHFTAVTAQRWLGGDATAATVIAPPRSWEPGRAEYTALAALLRTLARNDMVEGVRIDQVAARAAAGGPDAAVLVYPDEAVVRELPQGLFNRVQQLAGALASTQLAFAAVPTDDRATTAPDTLFAAVQTGLSRQAAGGFRVDLGAANRSNAAVQAVIDAVHGEVTITPPTSVYTLTSSTSPLLVTIGNRLPYTVHLRVEVNATDAVRAGITVTDVGVQTIPAFRSIQVPIPAEVTRSGSLTLRVKLTTPDGAAWGPQQELGLRSTAIGSFTVVLVVAAGAVVVLTTAIRIRKRYRQRRERIAAGLQ